MKYNLWLEDWLNNYIKPSNKIRTYERYKQLIDLHISKYLGEYDLNEITPSIIQHFITALLNNGNQLTGLGLSANTVNSIISIIQNSLKTANMLGFSDKYVADKLIRPKVKEKEIESFSVAEQKKIENYIMSSNKLKLYGIIICLYTGLRIGELLALSFNDIDFNKGILYIFKTCYDTPNGRLIDSPKTDTSRRVIPLPKQILTIIKNIKKSSQCEYLIADKIKPVSVRSYQRTFELLLKKLNIEHKGFHSLRHTFATRALECGMDVKTLSELLGHKNTNITLNRYVHSMLEHKQEMMNKLAKNLQKKSIE